MLPFAEYYWLVCQVAGTDKFAKVIDFLRRQLHRETMVDAFFMLFSLLLFLSLSLWDSEILILSIYCFWFGLATFKFVYVNSAFSPNPDELVLDLYNVSS